MNRPMKSSFSEKATYILFFVLLILVSARNTTFANSAIWNASASTNWNTNGNWFPTTGYPGTTVNDTAFFNNLSNVVVSIINVSPPFYLDAIIFTGSETHALGITVNPGVFLGFSGTGITNNSANTQNFSNNGNGGGNGGLIFTGSATAGSLTRFTNMGGVGGPFSGMISFNNTSTAGSGSFTNNGATVSGSAGGHLTFQDSANAGSGHISNAAGTINGALGGGTDFLGTSSADNGTFTNNGANVMGAFAGSTRFFNSSTADNSVFMNNGATVSTPNALSGGYTTFANTSSAGDGTFTNNGGLVSGAPGGLVQFIHTAGAGSATLIANAATGAGGRIEFRNDSTGGMASVDVRNNGTGTAGNLDISNHNAPGVTIGSLTGSGNVFLGSRNLTIGSNNHSTTFSGLLQDGGTGGGTGGSLSKIGTGTLTLSNANTYTGGTTISKGALVAKNTTGSATGPAAVQVNLGTLRGVGKIGGAVTVGNGSTSGAIILGGNSATSPGNLTINSALTFQSKATYKCALKRSTSGGQVTGVAGKVSALGVIINANVPFTFVDNGTGTLAVGTVFTVINNTSASPIAGTFSNLASGSIFTSNGNNFKVNYHGGTGNDLTLKVVP